MKKIVFLLGAISCGAMTSYSQPGMGTEIVPPTLNDSVINSFKISDNEFYFKGLWNLNAVTFLENYLHLLPLSPTGGLEILDIQKDDSTFHYWFKFQQLHNGYKVENRTVLFVEKGGKLLSISGNLVNNFKSDSGVPTINESIATSNAIDYARNHLSIDTFAWELANVENAYKEIYEDSTFTYYPSNLELVYTDNDANSGVITSFTLAWKVLVRGIEPTDNYSIYVDATTGSIIKHAWNVLECGQIGTADIHYNGTRNINTHYRGGLYNDYSLQHCTMGGTEIKVCRDFNIFGTPLVLLNNSNNWGTRHQNYTSVHWWASMAKEYFNLKHNRKHMVSEDEKLYVYQLSSPNTNNISAVYSYGVYSEINIPTQPNNSSMTYGTLDILGHEYTHGIITGTTKLNQSKEAFTLNEGFSDIFGNLIELNTLGNVNWLLGEDWYPRRSMSDPESTGNPKTYQGTYWLNYDNNIPLNSSISDPAIHRNITVISHWFYLLQQHIGIEKASKIAFRTGMNYLNSTSNFAHARIKSIEAAQHLFGDCSIEARKTAEAWNTVNVTPQPFTGCVSISGPGPSFCTTQLEVPVNYTFYAQTNAGDVSYWTITASGATYTTSGNSINITRFNSNLVSITATAHLAGGAGTRTHTEQLYFRNCPVGPLYFYGYNGQHTIWPADKYDRSPEIGEMQPFNKWESNLGSLHLYPNPTEKTLTISLDNSLTDILNIQILDVLGRVVAKSNINNGEQIDVSELSTGVYSVKVYTANDKGEKTLYSAKFIKN